MSASRRHHVSQGDGLPQHAFADPELQPAWRSHLGHHAELVLDSQSEPGYVEVTMAAVEVDQQIQVAARGCLAARHRAEDPDIAHAEPLAEAEDHIAVSPYLV